jgi:hypothetical protein
MLTLTLAGSGEGLVFADPAIEGDGLVGTFKQGTVVNLLATGKAGSLFTGWSGACEGTADACELTMDADQAVTATFEKANVFHGSFGGLYTNVMTSGGCHYELAAEGTLAFTLRKDDAGAVTGVGRAETAVTRRVLSSSTGTECTTDPAPADAVGSFTGTAASLEGKLTDAAAERPTEVVITASWNGDTPTGSLKFTKIVRITEASGPQDFPMSKTFTLVLNKVN